MESIRSLEYYYDQYSRDSSLTGGYVQLIATLNTGIPFSPHRMTSEGPLVNTSSQSSEAAESAETTADTSVRAELEETTAELRRLHDVTREMMEADTAPDLFRTVTEVATELLGFEYNTVRRYDTEREQLVPVAVSPPLRTERGDRRVYERGETVQWRAIDDGEIQVFQTVEDIQDGAERSGDGSMLVVPLAGFGVLTMGTQDAQAIDGSDVELARVFGANIETAINRVERLQTLQDRESELTQRAQQITVLNRGLRHNIRNELNLLMGWLTELDRAFSGQERTYVTRSLRAAREIDSLAKKARNIQETLADDCDVVEQDLVAVTVSQLERARAEYPTVSFETEFPDSAPVLAIDRGREAVWELLDNAVVHNDSSQSRIALRIEQVGNRQQLTIADNGPGLPRQERQVIAQESEHKLKHGSGLGLWYVKWLVEQSGGTLSFTESEFETGTAVQLRFQLPGSHSDSHAV